MTSSRMSHTSLRARFHHSLGVLDVGRNAQHDEAVHDEGLEQLQGHAPGQTAFVHLELGADDDHGASAVVDALSQEGSDGSGPACRAAGRIGS